MGKIKSKMGKKMPDRKSEIKCQSPKFKVQINVNCLRPKSKKTDMQNLTFEIYPLPLTFEL